MDRNKVQTVGAVLVPLQVEPLPVLLVPVVLVLVEALLFKVQ
jgi:hypothetical protein